MFELRRIVTKVRVAAIGYRRFLTPQRAALEKLAALPCDWLQDDDRLHLAAAADRAARMAEELESIRERAALMHEALTDLRAEQIDSRSLIISIAAMVFLPLTFITGLYGMNVKGLPYAEEPWAFDAICGVCAAIGAGVVIYFVKRHWFRLSARSDRTALLRPRLGDLLEIGGDLAGTARDRGPMLRSIDRAAGARIEARQRLGDIAAALEIQPRLEREQDRGGARHLVALDRILAVLGRPGGACAARGPASS